MKSWYILGDIIIVKSSNLSDVREIAVELLRDNPRCRCVVLDRGIKGVQRVPNRQVVYPEDASPVTVHKENGVMYEIDVCKLMFSKGNLSERIRMGMVGKDEIVIDMFAGIGQLSLPCAKWAHPKKIYAIEINPIAYRYLVRNVKLNKLDNVIPVLGDSLRVDILEEADRVFMGLIGDPGEIGERVIYIRKAIRFLGGNGILHYHESVPTKIRERPLKYLERAAILEKVSIVPLSIRRVKKFAPGVEHVVVDVKVEKLKHQK